MKEEKITKRGPSVISDVEFMIIKKRLKEHRDILKMIIGVLHWIIISLIVCIAIVADYEITFRSGIRIIVLAIFIVGLMFSFIMIRNTGKKL